MRHLAIPPVAAMVTLIALALPLSVLAQDTTGAPSPAPSAPPLSREMQREKFADSQKKLALLTQAASLTVAGRPQDRAA